MCKNYAFKASTNILFKSTKRFAETTFREHCSSLHQGEKPPDTMVYTIWYKTLALTMDQDMETIRKLLSIFNVQKLHFFFKFMIVLAEKFSS